MATQVWLQTKDGKVIRGINYSVNASTLPSSPAALAASMPGGMNYGMYHLRSSNGWVYIPASQITGVINVVSGAPT
jgi:hypothetical protein